MPVLFRRRMDKLSIQDLFFHYGIEIPRRFSRREKDFFLRGCGKVFGACGCSMKYVHRKVKGTDAANLVIGDVEKADTVLIANYDTPAHDYGNPMYYYPLDGRASLMASLVPTYAPALVSIMIIIYILWAWRKYIDFAKRPLLSFLLVAVMVLATILGWLFSGNVGNRINMNRNTSGVVAVMAILQELSPAAREKTAAILSDDGCYGHAGDYLSRSEFPCLDKKHVIVFNCVGNGSDLLIGYRHDSHALAKEATAVLKGSQMIACEGNALKYSSFSFYPSGILIARADTDTHVVKNVGGKDTDVDPESVKELCDSLSGWLNQKYQSR